MNIRANTTPVVTKEQIVHGLQLATVAATERLNRIGDSGSCGFVWVNVYCIRSNSKMGKVLLECGFYKADGVGSGLEYWNPSGLSVQSESVKWVGAWVFADYLKSLGFETSVGSCPD